MLAPLLQRIYPILDCLRNRVISHAYAPHIFVRYSKPFFICLTAEAVSRRLVNNM